MRLMLPLLACLLLQPMTANGSDKDVRQAWDAYLLGAAEVPGDPYTDFLLARSMVLFAKGQREADDNETSRTLAARAEVIAAELAARVDAARDANPYLLGADLGCATDGDAAVCRERRAKLEPFADDDAYHGLVLMTNAWGAGDAEGYLRAARLAASAPGYDSVPASGFGALVARFRQAPAPTARHPDPMFQRHGPEVTAMALSTAIAMPNFVNFVTPCREAKDELREHCLAIAKKMVASPGNQVDGWIGQTVVTALGTPDDVAFAAQKGRELAWLRTRSHPLLLASEVGPVAGMQAYFDAYAEAGEIEALRALLEAHDIAATPPADWRDPAAAGTP